MVAWKFAFVLLLGSTAAVAQTHEHAPVALKSANKLSQDKPGGENWTYVGENFRNARFQTICVLPTKIYQGADAQFENVAPADKQRFANILTTTLKGELSQAFTVLDTKSPSCMAVQYTLVGLQGTKGGIATATRVTPMGFALSTVKSLTGKRGSFTGSMLLAVEVTNGRTGEVLAAAVRRVSPDALDIPATLSTTDTVQSVAKEAARKMRERLLQSGAVVARR